MADGLSAQLFETPLEEIVNALREVARARWKTVSFGAVADEL